MKYTTDPFKQFTCGKKGNGRLHYFPQQPNSQQKYLSHQKLANIARPSIQRYFRRDALYTMSIH